MMETAAGSSSTVDGPFSADQIKSFQREGYLVVKAMFTPVEMICIRAWTDEIQH